MSKLSFNSRFAVEVLGGIAVVVSLLLVAFEVRQNTVAFAAQALSELNQGGNSLAVEISINPDLAELIIRGHQKPEALDEAERLRYEVLLNAIINNHEAAWIYREKGLIAEADFTGWKHSMCGFLSNRGVTQYWKHNTDIYIREFVTDVAIWCQD